MATDDFTFHNLREEWRVNPWIFFQIEYNLIALYPKRWKCMYPSFFLLRFLPFCALFVSFAASAACSKPALKHLVQIWAHYYTISLTRWAFRRLEQRPLKANPYAHKKEGTKIHKITVMVISKQAQHSKGHNRSKHGYTFGSGNSQNLC